MTTAAPSSAAHLAADDSPSSAAHQRRPTLDQRPVSRHHNVKHLRPFDTSTVKVLLVENVSQVAVDGLKAQGYQVEFHRGALGDEELKDKIRHVHAIGIRYICIIFVFIFVYGKYKTIY